VIVRYLGPTFFRHGLRKVRRIGRRVAE